MTTVLFRRRRLGLGSCQAICNASETDITIQTHNALARTRRREGPWPDDPPDWVIRWGCTAQIPSGYLGQVVNTAAAIGRVNNKREFRKLLDEHNLCPRTWFDMEEMDLRAVELEVNDLPEPVIVRPGNHAQGRNFYVCHTFDEVRTAWRNCFNPYISELINKVAEYRVFICQGRVVWIAQKTPGNPDDIAWNHAQGASFSNVRWGDWPESVIENAIDAFNLSGLDFGGVDVIVGEDGKPYTIEINSAPSQTSPYRQSCVAKAFDYIVRNGKDHISLNDEQTGWRRYIHPALRRNRE